MSRTGQSNSQIYNVQTAHIGTNYAAADGIYGTLRGYASGSRK